MVFAISNSPFVHFTSSFYWYFNLLLVYSAGMSKSLSIYLFFIYNREYLVVMKQRESSRIRNREAREIFPAVTLRYLQDKKMLFVDRKRQDLITPKHQHLAYVIEEEDLLESQS